jgi:hypothetical protein
VWIGQKKTRREMCRTAYNENREYGERQNEMKELGQRKTEGRRGI